MSPDVLQAASDGQLVIAVARGDDSALREVYGRYGGSMLALATRVVRDPSLAEEIVQEVVVRLWKAPERFDAERGSLRAFLLSDIHGRSVDAVRAEAARRRREERDANERLQAVAAGPEDEVLERALRAELEDALAMATDDEKRAIELAYFGGYSYREVAELLDEPEGTVKSRIRTGLLRMRGSLTEAGVPA